MLRRELGLKRLYDCPHWRKRTRPAVLDRDPLCTIGIRCGRMAASVDVDHIVPAEIYIAEHGGDESWFFEMENLRGACHACHAHKTALERRGLWREEMITSSSLAG